MTDTIDIPALMADLGAKAKAAEQFLSNYEESLQRLNRTKRSATSRMAQAGHAKASDGTSTRTTMPTRRNINGR